MAYSTGRLRAIWNFACSTNAASAMAGCCLQGPCASPLAPAQVTQTDHSPRVRVSRSLADYAYRADGTRRALWQWQGHSVRALAGIAKPDQFFADLQAQGLHLRQCIALPDHHDMQDVELEPTFFNGVQEDVLCTEKDAVKLWDRYPQVWAVPLQVNVPRELQDRLDALVMGSLKRTSSTRA